MPINVYALYYLKSDHLVPKRFFYVGRSKDVERRISEHIRAFPARHEDKYEFIRTLTQIEISWDVEILKVIPDGEYPPDNERFFVIDLVRKGHELTNMRHGSAEQQRQLARQVASPLIRGVSDVTKDRIAQVQAASIRKLGASRRLRKRILISALRKDGIPDLASDQLLPPQLRRRLLREGVGVVGPGVDLKQLVAYARPDKARKDFKAFVAKIEAEHPMPRPPGGSGTGSSSASAS